jgi:hypothetical protein
LAIRSPHDFSRINVDRLLNIHAISFGAYRWELPFLDDGLLQRNLRKKVMGMRIEQEDSAIRVCSS